MDLANICNGINNTMNLELVDGCFSIVKGANILSELCCFKGLVSPVDGFRRTTEQIESNSSFVIFDNKFDVSPSNSLRLQTRGFIIFVGYPTIDDAGIEIDDSELNLIIRITNNNGESFDVPFYLFYSVLNNPITTDVDNLINKVEIINNNNYTVNASILTILVNRDGVSLESGANVC
jgi:hypothetical protein